jgi:L-lysine exporter family protein LysE/ArgO
LARGLCWPAWCSFFTLGFGARLVTPFFAKPVSWQVLDGIIALTMWGIAAKLLMT